MKNKRTFYIIYDCLPFFTLQATSFKNAIKQLDKKSMSIPNCIEDSRGGIWWKEDNA